MAILLFVLFLVLILINVPIAISLALSSVIVIGIIGEIPLIMLPQKMFAALDSFPLMAAPFFILAGKLMEIGGISERLVRFASSLVGQFKGGLAQVSIIACLFFAALSGSGTATTAAIGGIMIPAMVKAGYGRNFATAIQAVGGTTGIIIPPSVPLVLYGVSAGVSISSLFIAGILPGILFGLLLMLVAFIISKKKGYGASDERVEVWKSFKDAILALLMPVIILGGIYAGIFTPTEASVVAVVYGFVIGTFVYRQINWESLKKILVESVVTTSVILFIISAASMFGMLLTREQIPQSIAGLIMDANLTPIATLLLINVFLLVVGTFMEAIAAIVILTPILLPIVIQIGIDPIHFGIIMTANLAIGLITPPVGVSLFVGARVGNTEIEPLARAVLPFLAVMIIGVLIITFVPQITMLFLN